MIYSINKINKSIALQIMRNAMHNNPNLSWITGNDEVRLDNMYNFCLRLAMLYKGAYLNCDKNGIVLFYRRGEQNSWLLKIKTLKIYLPLVVKTIQRNKLIKVYNLQNKIKKLTSNKPHIYCLIIAVSPFQKSTQTIINLRDFLFEKSRKEQLPIYIQTSVRRNKILFEKYGFQCYQELQNGDYKLWLLKRDYER